MPPMVGCGTMPETILGKCWLLLWPLALLMVISSGKSKKLDPAKWGSDHVGKPIPEYVTGDECLFCHRKKIGPSWQANRHHLTIRLLDDTPAQKALQRSSLPKDLLKEIKYVMGDEHRQRFLKPAKDYGKLELLNVEWIPPREKQSAKWISTKKPHWDTKTFGNSCAGCHTTAVDSKEQSFSSLSLDCFVCHGNVTLEHSKKPELVHLSKKRKDPARVVISICAQCHIRSGTSKSSGRPFPNNFIAGDNLFRDFKVKFTEEHINKQSVMDRHILQNVRDVVVLGKTALPV